MAGFSGYLRAIGAAVFIALTAACTPVAAPPADPAVVVAETTAFLDQWVAAREKGDKRVLEPMYSAQPGFRWIENGAVTYDSGLDAAASLDMASTGGYLPDMTLAAPAITVLSADAAAVTADYKMIFKFGGIAFDSTGVFTAVLVKEDGLWKFLQAHMSEPSAGMDMPAPAPEVAVVEQPVAEPVVEPAPAPQ